MTTLVACLRIFAITSLVLTVGCGIDSSGGSDDATGTDSTRTSADYRPEGSICDTNCQYLSSIQADYEMLMALEDEWNSLFGNEVSDSRRRVGQERMSLRITALYEKYLFIDPPILYETFHEQWFAIIGGYDRFADEVALRLRGETTGNFGSLSPVRVAKIELPKLENNLRELMQTIP